MATCATTPTLHFHSPNTKKTHFSSPKTSKIYFSNNIRTDFCTSCLASYNFKKTCRVLCGTSPTTSSNTTHYEFSDGPTEVELRLELGNRDLSSRDILVDANEKSLTARVRRSGSVQTLMDTNSLYDKIKPAETIWYIDDDQLVINLQKQDPELKWPDIVESWESLSTGLVQLLKGTSIFLVGESTEINEKIAQEIAVGLGYTPLSTKELLEAVAKQTIDSWVSTEGSDEIAEAESTILESLSSYPWVGNFSFATSYMHDGNFSQARAVVATLGGKHGAAGNANKWRHLFAGFTVWLSQSEASDEDSAKEEVRRHIRDGGQGYANAEVVVKLSGWDATYSKTVAQASLSALKQLILSDKQLPGKRSLYIRLGCRGDWPDIKPPGWDPSTGADASLPVV